MVQAIQHIIHGLFQYLNDSNQYEFKWMAAGSVPAGVAHYNGLGWESVVKKARGLDGEIEKVFGERERLRG